MKNQKNREELSTDAIDNGIPGGGAGELVELVPGTLDDTHDAISLNIINDPDDVPPKEPASIADKAKDFLKNFVSPPPADDTTKKRSSSTRKKKQTFQNWAVIASGYLAVWIGGYFDDQYKEVAPNEEQLENILKPLARIADRSVPSVEIDPNVSDAMMSLWAIVIYSIQARATYVMIKKDLEKKAEIEKNEKQVNIAFRDFQSIN